MNRQLYLVAYDIGCNNRRKRALDAVRCWRAEGQKSVSECFMTVAERDHLCRRLDAIINSRADRLHVLRLDPRMKPRLLGTARRHDGRLFLIV